MRLTIALKPQPLSAFIFGQGLHLYAFLLRNRELRQFALRNKFIVQLSPVRAVPRVRPYSECLDDDRHSSSP